MSSEEIVQRGEELYGERLRALLEPEEAGKTLVLDVETGEYELDNDPVAAIERAVTKRPDGMRYIKRIGYPIRLEGRLAPRSQ